MDAAIERAASRARGRTSAEPLATTRSHRRAGAVARGGYAHVIAARPGAGRWSTRTGQPWASPRREHAPCAIGRSERWLPSWNARLGRRSTTSPPRVRRRPEEETHHDEYPWLRAGGSDPLGRARPDEACVPSDARARRRILCLVVLGPEPGAPEWGTPHKVSRENPTPLFEAARSEGWVASASPTPSFIHSLRASAAGHRRIPRRGAARGATRRGHDVGGRDLCGSGAIAARSRRRM